MRRLTFVGITTEDFWEGEACAIEWLLENGLDRLHIRKPRATIEQHEQLVVSINPSLRSKIVLHDAFPLAQRWSLGGIHLNSRNPQSLPSFAGSVSRSCHSLDEIEHLHQADYDYLFLSPIYDSISKSGYSSAFSLTQLEEGAKRGLIDSRIIALGGITPDRFGELSQIGFGGVALLGYLWGDKTLLEIQKRNEICYNSLHTAMID